MTWAGQRSVTESYSRLLKKAADVLLTADKTLSDENVISGRGIGLVAMSDNHWKIICDYVPAIVEALHKAKPGQVSPVFCGEFVRRRTTSSSE